MRIIRDDKVHERDNRSRLVDVQLHVWDNLVAARASERYYAFVGENSYLPLSDLIYPEDGSVLRQEITRVTDEPLEFVTGITNRKDGYRIVYLRVDSCEETCEGRRTWLVTLYDLVDMENRDNYLEGHIAKYRQFMSLHDGYYFEYHIRTDHIAVYKYINERSVTIHDESLESFLAMCYTRPGCTETQKQQLEEFRDNLRQGLPSFEMELTGKANGEETVCKVRASRIYKDHSLIVGLLQTNEASAGGAYYLTPAARDAGTGLMNKKAAMEYAMERLGNADGQPIWLMMMDIDDFKSINDNFGHLFGDEVIRRVAEIWQQTIGYRGCVGRFGGDEYFVLLEKAPTREALKLLIKTAVKEMYCAFDPKLRITMSIGVSRYPDDGTTYEELLGKADKALYIAKEKGKDRHIIYDEGKHGSFHKTEGRVKAVEYTFSKQKRREALVEILGNLNIRGVEYITGDPEVQEKLLQIFDIDGFTVFADYGQTLVCRCGEYHGRTPDVEAILQDTGFRALYAQEDVLVDSNLMKLKTQCPAVCEMLRKQEIGATIECIAREGDRIRTIVGFDIFNRSRKWSDTDVEMMSVIGCCIAKQIS